MHGTVDHDHGDLVPVARIKRLVGADVALHQLSRGLVCDGPLDHRSGVVTEMTPGLREQEDLDARHPASLRPRLHWMLMGASEDAAMTHASAPSETPILAFFDVDNTLMRGASVYHLGWAAWKRGFLTARELLRFTWKQLRFIAVGENHRHQLAVRDRALELIAGHTVDELESLAVETYEKRIQKLLLPETVGLAQDHLDKGHEVWLITATPEACARVIAERLGLTGAIGTRIRDVDGIFTGELLGRVMHGTEKALAAKDLAVEKHAKLEDCWAYSDSRNDIPLLELAGNRVVVNPDATLKRYARARNWPMITAGAASIRAQRRRVRREARAVARDARGGS
jgi:HAD superfamily hydrolase (TIGR01490 family)